MCSYLHRAPNGRYYFRMGIPASLRPFFDGKREIKQALNTADRETAKGLIPDLTSDARRQLNEARIALGVPAPSRPGEPVPAVPKRPRTRREALEDWDRDQVEFSEGPGSLEPEEWQEWVASQGKGKGLYLDTDILDGWAAEMQPEARGKAAYASSAKLFNTTMGRKSVELISKADVMAYKNKLIAEGRSQVNVRDHLAYIRTLFKWAAQNDHIPANPVQDVRMAVKAKAEKRQDFNIDDLNALLAGPVHAERLMPKDKRAGGEAAYWLPLLALFMGARREELGQLRISDVQQAPYIDGEEKRQEVWCIDITDTPDAEGLANQVKNAGSRRLIPLHPKLIELGFIDYVQGLPDQRGRVFPLLTPSGIGQKLTDKWGQWFSQYKRKCGITDKLKVFHSFRHTWKTYAVDAGMAERICRQFQGHEGKDAADKYGASPSMRVLVEAIASYRVPGLVIPAP